MPRGNDAKAAYDELRERYSSGVGSAEDSLRSARALNPPELKRASLKPVDAEASRDLDLDKVAGDAGYDKVLDAVVRGGDTVYVAVDEDGRTHKGVLVGGDEKPEVEDRHLERIRALAEESEKNAEEREKAKDEEEEGGKLTGAEAKEKKEREKAIEQAAQEGSLRAKARAPEKVREELDDRSAQRGMSEEDARAEREVERQTEGDSEETEAQAEAQAPKRSRRSTK